MRRNSPTATTAEPRRRPRAASRALFMSVMARAYARLKAGEAVYGSFDPITDRRTLRLELEEELLDAVCYCYLAVLRIRGEEGP